MHLQVSLLGFSLVSTVSNLVGFYGPRGTAGVCVQRSELWTLQALAVLSAWNDVRSTVCLLQGGRRDFRPDNCCLNLLSLLEDIGSWTRSASLVYFLLVWGPCDVCSVQFFYLQFCNFLLLFWFNYRRMTVSVVAILDTFEPSSQIMSTVLNSCIHMQTELYGR